MPTLNDRYWAPGGNPDLRPETAWSADLDQVTQRFIDYHQSMTKLEAQSGRQWMTLDLEQLLHDPGAAQAALFAFLELDPARVPMKFIDALEARADRLRRTINLWKSYRPQLGQLHEALKAAQAMQWTPQSA